MRTCRFVLSDTVVTVVRLLPTPKFLHERLLVFCSPSRSDFMRAKCTDTYSWLRSFKPPLDRYSATLSRHGFETIFALGLIEDFSTLTDIGIWEEDAERIYSRLDEARSLVSLWDSFITKVPVIRISLSEFLLMTPVPHLASHVRSLKSIGYDHVSCFKCVEASDLELISSIPIGHRLSMLKISLSASTSCFPVLPSIDIPLSAWLSHLSPPMHRYENTLLLLTALDSFSVPELLSVEKSKLMALPMPLGHKRALWYYVVRERLYWVGCLS